MAATKTKQRIPKPKRPLETIVSTPAVALEKTISVTTTVTETIQELEPVRKASSFWETLGPGLTTGAADDDPSGIATYSQTGAQYGNRMLWLAAFTFPLMATVEEMCARIGMVTGRGLAANIGRYFPRWALITTTILLFFANTFNLGADLGAMAKGIQLVYPQLDFGFLVLCFVILSLGLQIFSTYEKYASYLKYLALVLLSYVVTVFFIPHIDWRQLALDGLIPHLSASKDELLLICAILGTTISPYLFFWQTAQEVEDQILDGNVTIKSRQALTTPKQIRDMRIDVWSGMLLSNMVMFFIIAVTSATLHSHGITTINTAADAAEALRPLAGDGAFFLFTVGMVGTGLLAIPVLAGSTAYALAETFGWRHGLYRKLHEASAFYGILIISMLVGLALNFVGLDPIKALIYSSVANGIIAPIVLVFIVLLASNRKIMGEWTNSRSTTWIGWLITGAMAVVGLLSVYILLTQ